MDLSAFISQHLQQKEVDLFPFAFPIWYEQYKLLTNQQTFQQQIIYHSEWSQYWGSIIQNTQHRLLMAMTWPYLPRESRHNLMRALQSRMNTGLLAFVYYQNLIQYHKNTILFENSQHVIQDHTLNQTIAFDFMISDHHLFFTVPYQPYHNTYTIYHANVDPHIITNMVNQPWLSLNKQLKKTFLLDS
jgi:hypothetical protein